MASIAVGAQYFGSCPLKEKVPIAYCVNESDTTKKESFIPAILVSVTKKQWELMDKNDDSMEQLEWDADNSLANSMIDMYSKHADTNSWDYFKGMCFASKSAMKVITEVTP
jgi:hypothetical protein